MRLTALDPHWVTVRGIPEMAIGLTMLCPHCGERMIYAYFDKPIFRNDFDKSLDHSIFEQLMRDYPLMCRTADGQIRQWHREGDTWDTLTLTPSIDGSKYGHWHGCITNGEIK